MGQGYIKWDFWQMRNLWYWLYHWGLRIPQNKLMDRKNKETSTKLIFSNIVLLNHGYKWTITTKPTLKQLEKIEFGQQWDLRSSHLSHRRQSFNHYVLLWTILKVAYLLMVNKGKLKYAMWTLRHLSTLRSGLRILLTGQKTKWCCLTQTISNANGFKADNHNKHSHNKKLWP